MRRKFNWMLGLLSKRSCYRADGTPKQRYPTRQAAAAACIAMGHKNPNKAFEPYRCLFRCRKWHIGRQA